MKILDRYIGWTIIASTLTVLVVLVGIFSFFGFIEQLDDVGKGTYTLMRGATYVFLMLPSLTYQLFPMAALIGALIGFGTLMRNGEITVIRAAGVPKARVVASVLKAGFLMLLVVVVVGEVLAPPSERSAREMKGEALNERVSFSAANGFWSRDRRSYVNIREIQPDNRLKDIYIYEFDDLNRLRSATHADGAHYDDNTWILENVSRTELDDEGMRARQLPEAVWDSSLRPDLLAMVRIEPESLGMVNLIRYIRFLSRNSEDSLRYRHALWTKLTYPLATVVMVFLAVPMVLRANRSVSVGQRVLVGALIGLGFHLLNQASGHLGIVYEMPPWLSAGGPGLLMLGAAALLLARTP